MKLHLQKYAPSPELQPYIRFYYVISTEGQPGEFIELDNHPQGAIDLQFTLQGQIGYTNSKQKDTPLGEVFLIGQHDSNFKVRFHPSFKVVGVTFTAEGFGKLFFMPMNELTNFGAEITDILEKDDRFLLERLAELADDKDRLQLLDDFFFARLYRNDIPFDPIDHAIRKVRASGGQLSITDLAEEFNTSARTLQRKFAMKIGLSPKTYARIMRINKVLLMLKHLPQADWMDVLHNCGYYDQMHFIKDFKHFTGQTPGEYKKGNTELGEFFLDE